MREHRGFAREHHPAPRLTGADDIDRVLAQILSLSEARPARSSRRLDGLFRDLSQATPRREPDDIEEMIWAIWISHDDPDAAGDMIAACEAIASDTPELARPRLDRLAEADPSWAEVWNKRATLAFIEDRIDDAVSDIGRTLLLEPRHFGAVSGFGQACLRLGRWREAGAAFSVALQINPHLKGLQEALTEIGAAVARPH